MVLGLKPNATQGPGLTKTQSLSLFQSLCAPHLFATAGIVGLKAHPAGHQGGYHWEMCKQSKAKRSSSTRWI